MRIRIAIAAVFSLVLAVQSFGNDLVKLNAKLNGAILDYTFNHGEDRRGYSKALDSKRDLYVYLPPGYDGRKEFPVLIWMHGVINDEKTFVEYAPHFDALIASGKMPATVIVAPDLSVNGRVQLLVPGSFALNTKAGRFEDYMIGDVWPWVKNSFRIESGRESHWLGGFSMGGYAAYQLAFKHREEFGAAIGLMPPLDLRYADATGGHLGDYDPATVSSRNVFRRRDVVGRFFGIPIRLRVLFNPLFGRFDPIPLDFIKANNPTDMLNDCVVRPNEFALFAGYGTNDEFNMGAQVKRFADVASRRGVAMQLAELPGGKHNNPDGIEFLPALAEWLSRQTARR